MTKRVRMLALGSGGAILLAVMTLGGIFYFSNRPVGDGKNRVEFEVKAGWGSIVVTNRLHKEKLIGSRTVFRYLLRITGNAGSIKKGLYDLNDGMTPNEIIEIITSGKTKTTGFTIPEGLHNRQLGELLAEKGFFTSRDEFLRLASDKSLLKKYSIPADSAEGYLFPETYVIPVKYPKEKIIERMIKEFYIQVGSIEGFPKEPQKIHEVVTMASIVEREARKKEERALIAGVLYNRLENDHKLQVDASIQYLFPRQRKKVYYKDLEIESPYNTYLNKGLPPGPISNPGLSSLKAAVHPEKTKYFFYVAKPDGSHFFAESYRDHLKAKKKYID